MLYRIYSTVNFDAVFPIKLPDFLREYLRKPFHDTFFRYVAIIMERKDRCICSGLAYGVVICVLYDIHTNTRFSPQYRADVLVIDEFTI